MPKMVASDRATTMIATIAAHNLDFDTCALDFDECFTRSPMEAMSDRAAMMPKLPPSPSEFDECFTFPPIEVMSD